MLTNASAQVRFLMNVVKAGKTAVLVYHTGCLSACVCVCVLKTHITMPQTQTGTKRLLIRSQTAGQRFHPCTHPLALHSKNPDSIVFFRPFFLYSRKLGAFKWLIPYFLPLAKFHHMLCFLQHGLKTRMKELTFP